MHTVVVVILAVTIGACSESPPAWPPPDPVLATCAGTRTGDPCATAGWCNASPQCGLVRGCYCNGDSYECTAADALCELGEGATCALEGNAACNTPPVGGTCTCTDGQTVCERSCPLPECPDYDASSETCICRDGTCP